MRLAGLTTAMPRVAWPFPRHPLQWMVNCLSTPGWLVNTARLMKNCSRGSWLSARVATVYSLCFVCLNVLALPVMMGCSGRNFGRWLVSLSRLSWLGNCTLARPMLQLMGSLSWSRQVNRNRALSRWTLAVLRRILFARVPSAPVRCPVAPLFGAGLDGTTRIWLGALVTK